MKATVGGSGVIFTREQNKKRKKKYTGVQFVHFYQLLQVDIISKRENSLVYIGRQVNSLTRLSSLFFFFFFFFRLIQVKSIVETP